MLYFYFLFFEKMLGVDHPTQMSTPTFIIEPSYSRPRLAGEEFYIFRKGVRREKMRDLSLRRVEG